ncbi:hypothetical protein PYW07_004715 [Mythimna separata]|uniref:Uncharacterized protein n=1 Tax=Mythimna separata TaxID=271217 RepID=A0AAD7YY72_MYTSE|nr:hypothetical protein PYW07_004715 [Mythimna separata]
MEYWKNKVAIVTGAAHGIGAQIAEDLAKIGMTVIGFEPTQGRLDEMLNKMIDWGKFEGQLIPCKCDVSKDEDLKKAFEGIVATYGGVDVLINNAAIDCGDEVGFAIMEQLAKAGMIVIGFNKNEDLLEKVTVKLNPVISNKISGKIVLCKCDISDTKQLTAAFEKIKDTYEGIDVLINNAQCNIDCLVNTGESEDFKEIVDVNINALVACTRLAAGSMIARETRGHIICMNDLCSYQIPTESKKTVYIATKATITSVNEILRHEFRFLKANIKVTNIAYGKIEENDSNPDTPGLRVKDIAKLVKLILNTPEQLQVHEVLLDSVVE